jgi:hypothetical protein
MKRLPFAVGAIAVVLSAACANDFDPKNLVNGVRVLAVKSDPPYAKPGETVKIEALTFDGRKTPAEPMKFFWFPAPCVDPPAGAYFLCYAGLNGLPLRTDLTPILTQANTTQVTIAPGALANAKPRPGEGSDISVTYYVFFMACAGHVERVERGNNVEANAIPVGYFNSAGQQLGQESFVFGFTRVFVFGDRRNAVPTMDGLTYQTTPIDPKVAVRIPKCTKDPCGTKEFDVRFNEALAERDPSNIGPNGEIAKETLYVDWFTTIGKFDGDRRILFDPFDGRAPKTFVSFEPPREVGTGRFWAVMHDNRGGVSWLEGQIQIDEPPPGE